jgi:hypothetical protein
MSERYIIEVEIPNEPAQGRWGYSAATILRKHFEKALREAWFYPKDDPADWIKSVRRAPAPEPTPEDAS